ncbi:MAG TPA: LemA family protein [Candidatus Solibacter sp.]|nr:LemA family protein [Candidatus Solibacter sp.]
MSAIIVLAILVVVAVVILNSYNRLAQLRLRCDTAWSDIAVQLKRRHELIPELIEIVRKRAPEADESLVALGELRARAMQATKPADCAAVESELAAALVGILADAERNPQLNGSEELKPLRTSLDLVESVLASAQRYYNSLATNWNATVRSFPSSMLAGVFGFAPRQLFEADEISRPVYRPSETGFVKRAP